MKNKIIPYNPKLKEFARQLRKNSTLSEVLFWQKVKGKSLGVEFHRQVPLLEYIVDFYGHELKLAIEIDGIVICINIIMTKGGKANSKNAEWCSYDLPIWISKKKCSVLCWPWNIK